MDGVILMNDVQGEKNENVVFSTVRKILSGTEKRSPVNILRGELLLPIREEIPQRKDGQVPHNYFVKRDPKVSLYCNEFAVTPLNGDEFRLLEGIRSRSIRYDVFKEGKKLEWALTLQTDIEVYAIIPGKNPAKSECTAAIIRYVGPLEDQLGTVFGIEILVSSFIFCFSF